MATPNIMTAMTSPTPAQGYEDVARDDRQRRVAEWCAAAFGTDHAASVEQRGLRLLEEAIEAYQAAGCNVEQAHKLLDYVFARPAGKLHQELGGVGITLLALANACGASAEAEEVREFSRVLSKPLAHFAARNKVKNDAGFAAHPLQKGAAVDAETVRRVLRANMEVMNEFIDNQWPVNTPQYFEAIARKSAALGEK